MRIITSLVAFCVFAGCAGPQQTAGVNDGDAPLETSLIYIEGDFTLEEGFSLAGDLLQQERFTISSSDRDLGSINTEAQQVTDTEFGFIGTTTYVQLSIYVEENQIRLSGQHGESQESYNQEIKKFGQSGSMTRNAWAVMHQLAEMMADNLNGQLNYE